MSLSRTKTTEWTLAAFPEESPFSPRSCPLTPAVEDREEGRVLISGQASGQKGILYIFLDFKTFNR